MKTVPNIQKERDSYYSLLLCSVQVPFLKLVWEDMITGKDENAVLANLGMRTVATPAGGHCLLHAFIRTKEIKYGNSDPCNERENKLLKPITSFN